MRGRRGRGQFRSLRRRTFGARDDEGLARLLVPEEAARELLRRETLERATAQQGSHALLDGGERGLAAADEEQVDGAHDQLLLVRVGEDGRARRGVGGGGALEGGAEGLSADVAAAAVAAGEGSAEEEGAARIVRRQHGEGAVGVGGEELAGSEVAEEGSPQRQRRVQPAHDRVAEQLPQSLELRLLGRRQRALAGQQHGSVLLCALEEHTVAAAVPRRQPLADR
jgi:hypothetical protein